MTSIIYSDPISASDFHYHLQLLMSIESKFREIITSNRVALFVKSPFPHSNHVRDLLPAYHVPQHTEEIDMYAEHEMRACQEHFENITGAHIVPRIFINGECIGGKSDSEWKYIESGKITQLTK